VSAEVSSTRTIATVRFVVDGRTVRASRRNGLWVATLGKLAPGRHVLGAVASGPARRLAVARRIVRTCPS
jgi:hypothetical protein